ncbi:BPI-like_protein [Hexamita inflata]|uniref:BPI-like protein n=1 Tax=Hexamita inflata TaxID=28002 RepID=A0AA86P6X2_9EUKA|nr:BPI-like protein [Hexamita inflata]
MFSLVILAERTCELGFSQIINQSYTAQSTTATQRGAKKYMLCGIKDSMKPISNIVIPDLKFELNAGITKIDVALTDQINLLILRLKLFNTFSSSFLNQQGPFWEFLKFKLPLCGLILINQCISLPSIASVLVTNAVCLRGIYQIYQNYCSIHKLY